MKFITFWKETFKSLLGSIERFYIPLGFSTLLFFVLVTISEISFMTNYDTPTDLLERFAMILFLGFFVSLCVQLFFENHLAISKEYKLLIYFLSMVFLLVFYFYFLTGLDGLSTVFVYRYIITVSAFILGLFFVPHIKNDDFIQASAIKIVMKAFITILYALVLYLGISAIMLAMNKLLNFPINDRSYLYSWLLVATVFSPAFFLGGFPKNNTTLASYKYPAVLKILILYIIIPLSTIYLGILYLYFAKIIVTRTWPIGLVSHLVLWFSVLCVGVFFLSDPIKDNPWITKYKSYLPKLLLPLLTMMFVSMGIRMQHYGITENRYYVIMLGVWVLFLMVYFILAKSPNHTLVPMSLSLLLIISVFGPLSSFTISKWSQNHRLTNILNRYTMIEQGAIIPNPDVNSNDQNEIFEILYYFEQNHSLSDVKYVNPDFEMDDREKVFGFSYDTHYSNKDAYVNYYRKDDDNFLTISGFDYMANMNNVSNEFSVDNLLVTYSDTGILDIYLDKDIVYHANFTDYLSLLNNKFPNESYLPNKDMVFTDENHLIKVKFLFSHLSGNLNDDQSITFDNSDFKLLLKIK